MGGGALACGAVVSGDTSGSAAGSTAFGHASPEHVFSIVVSESAAVSIDTCGSAFDTFLRVFERCPRDAGAELERDDDSGCGTAARLTFSAQAGRPYLVLLEGFGDSAAGAYELRVSCAAEGEADAPAEDDGSDADAVAALVRGSLQLDAEPDEWVAGAAGAAEKWDGLAGAIASVVDVAGADVTITGVTGGSVVVDFEIRARDDGDGQPSKLVAKLEAGAAELAQRVQASTGVAVLGGGMVQGLHVVIPSAPPPPSPDSGSAGDDDDDDDDDSPSGAANGPAQRAPATVSLAALRGEDIALIAGLGAAALLSVVLCACAAVYCVRTHRTPMIASKLRRPAELGGAAAAATLRLQIQRAGSRATSSA